MTISDDPTFALEQHIEQTQYVCCGNRLHDAPLFWAMWLYQDRWTGKRWAMKETNGLLCEKCIIEFRALRVPNKKF